MRTIEQLIDEQWDIMGIPENGEEESAIQRALNEYESCAIIEKLMSDYAKEILRDFDNWKAHKTPDLIERYIKKRNI